MLYRSTTPETFATLFFGLLDPARKSFLFCNAGHNYPILTTVQGEVHYLQAGGLLLGMIEQVEHKEEEVKLSSGDVIVFYTDGLTEATDGQGLMFGENRLERIVSEGIGASAAEISKKIMNEVEHFSGRADYDDDVTLVVLKTL
jgi:sigma-B regulation protein RsbU (phosphoserine phosphatase)